MTTAGKVLCKSSMLDTPSGGPPARPATPANPDFLTGGGEVGARLRALDWQANPLGPPESWPQSLKTIVRMMLDSRYAMWMLWGPELTFFCNDAYLPTVGIKRDWVLGARSDKVWEEIWPDIGPRIERVLEHAHATWDEGLLLFLERSGFPEETYHTFSYSPVYDDDNRVAGMLCVVTEVTERVIGERRLRVLRDLASPQAGVQGVDAVCRHACEVLAKYPFDVPFAALYRVNAAAQTAQCVARTHALDDTVPATLVLTDAAARWPAAAVFATETAQELHDLPKAGIEIPTEQWPDLVNQAFLLPLPAAAQQGLAGILIVGISPRRPLDEAYRSFIGLVGSQVSSALAGAHAYEAERRRAEALAELDRAKTAFFSNVSHEFRTPLTLMLGPLEGAVADERIPQEQRRHLELAQHNAERLRKLVNSLLDFSRIEAGRVQASYEPTDLAALTRDLASTFRSAMEKADLELVVECAPLDAPVFVDREMWEKIVLNLLSNAFKFTLQGSVTVRLTRDADHALLEVADTGVGVAEHELPRLFQRFYRVEGAQGRTHEGSGIGLALVQELVKQHGGTIAAASRVKLGTTFAVRVPFGTEHLPSQQITMRQGSSSTVIGAQAFVQEALRWLQNAPADATTTLATLAATSTAAKDRRFVATFGSRIVLADDNSDMRGYMRELLAPYYDVEALADGEQALAAARRARPDLILSDVMMPRLDGFGLLAAIRADAALRSVPVVLLSARAGEEARIEGLDAGADDYLIKPFSARELLARVGALLELTQMRRAAEEAFRLRTAQFETLLMEAPLGVYLVDADFRIREANPTAREVFGNPPDLVGSDFAATIHRLWPKQYAEEVVQRFRHTLATGESYFTPERIETRADSGVVEYYEWQISRIPLPDARFGVVCYFRDISAHVLARRKLETADRQKDEFLAMLAHELRNPLAPIRSAAEVLARTAPAATHAHSAVNVVQRQVGILVRLVDDLLDVSRITQGRIELKRKPIKLADVIAQAVETVDPLIKERRHGLSVTSHGMLRVNGDAARLVQCVANVLTNAAKYTDPGGEIRVESRADGGEAVLAITDNGVGIPAALLPHLFELFVQSARTLDRSQGGLGIGLSVVKRLIEMHGGDVTASSRGTGLGATFEIRLPLAAAQDEPAEVAAHATPSKRRVLVVDDNADAANTLAMLLGLDGHEVRAVYSANAALDAAQAFEPDVVLLDIGLPEMDGYEVARRIREQPALAGLRLVALTGYGQTEDKQRTRAAGFDDHLVKPVEMRALQEAMARTKS
jgi:PAS domain S-box-containing protein